MGSTASRSSVAFLFTDIQSSTRRWEQYPDAMMGALEHHNELLAQVVERNSGTIFHFSGDGIIASFATPSDALAAAVASQRAIGEADWSMVDGLRVRMALHVGEVVIRDGEPFGWALNFGARFNAIGHGGQVLLSETAKDALANELNGPLRAKRLGRQRLRDIAQPADVFQLIGPDLESDFPPLRDTVRPTQLLGQPQLLIGRGGDVAEIVRILGSNRLVTILGPAGVGSSRVAIEVANQVARGHEHGIQHCDLVDVSPQRMSDAIATSLGVGLRRGRSVEESLIDWIAERDILLVLEHAGHGVETIARLVRSLLARTPNTTILCTSQRPLDVDGECLHRLNPLDLDDAVALFIERARLGGGTVADSPELRTLCTRLNQMPFAIEVAAANSSIYTIADLTDMFDRRELPDSTHSHENMQSVSKAMAVGIDALSTELRTALAAASTFVGTFDRAAFAAVCAPSVSAPQAYTALAELANRSLIQADQSDGMGQFRILDIVADSARAGVPDDEIAAANERFLDYILGFIGDAAAGLRGPDELLWNIRVRQQFDNIRGAFSRSLSQGDIARASAIVTMLWDYGFMRMREEYFRWSEQVIETFTNKRDEVALAPVLGVAALGAWIRDGHDDAQEWALRAIRLEADNLLEFDLPARLALINSTVYSGSSEAPIDLFIAQAEYQRARPELYFHVNVDTQNSIMATWTGDQKSAERRAIRSVKLARESRNPSSLAFALWALGSALDVSDPVRAESLLGTSLETAREVENDWVTALVQMSLASLRRRLNSPIDAIPLLIDLLELLWRAGHRSHLWATIRLCSLVLGDLGQDELALQLDCSVRSAEMAMPPLPIDAEAVEHQLMRIRSDHSEQWVARATSIATTWDAETAVQSACTELERQLAKATS